MLIKGVPDNTPHSSCVLYSRYVFMVCKTAGTLNVPNNNIKKFELPNNNLKKFNSSFKSLWTRKAFKCEIKHHIDMMLEGWNHLYAKKSILGTWTFEHKVSDVGVGIHIQTK